MGALQDDSFAEETMKNILIWGIRLYQNYLPNRYKRCCLFRESCSMYSIRKIGQDGVIVGMASTVRRIQRCRPGFTITHQKGEMGIILTNGEFVAADELSPEIISPYSGAAARLSAHYNQ